MAVGHAFRRSRSFQLFLSLIFTGEVVFALARRHTSDNHDFTRFPLHGPSIGLFDRAVAYNQTRCGRHYTPTISRKGFSSSRVAYYPNSVSSFQTSFLMRSGDINPNPGQLTPALQTRSHDKMDLTSAGFTHFMQTLAVSSTNSTYLSWKCLRGTTI